MSARNTGSEEARQVLDEAGRRVSAMAAAQRVLYATPNAGRFEAQEFLDAVCGTLRQTLPPGADLICQPTHGLLATDIAMPLSLIVNELITNAVKHFAADSGNRIILSLTQQDGHYRLCVEDSGEGFDLPTVRKASSGLQLVLGLARQIQGTVSNTRKPSQVWLSFPSGDAS
jgi:two-component sensor histidine kinase